VLSEIEDVCDRAVFLKAGKLVLNQRLDSLRDRHLVWGTSDQKLSPPDFGDESQLVTKQADDGKFCFDVAGKLAPVLQWLLGETDQSKLNLRIEPVRLRTVYDTVHFSEHSPLDVTLLPNVGDPDDQ
jgi:ABC-type multidrug transport system ATPase subunit